MRRLLIVFLSLVTVVVCVGQQPAYKALKIAKTAGLGKGIADVNRAYNDFRKRQIIKPIRVTIPKVVPVRVTPTKVNPLKITIAPVAKQLTTLSTAEQKIYNNTKMRHDSIVARYNRACELVDSGRVDTLMLRNLAFEAQVAAQETRPLFAVLPNNAAVNKCNETLASMRDNLCHIAENAAAMATFVAQEASAETPAEAPAEASAETPAETPAEAPAEAPVQPSPTPDNNF